MLYFYINVVVLNIGMEVVGVHESVWNKFAGEAYVFVAIADGTRYMFLMSMHMYIVPIVLRTLFHITLVVIRSAVRVVSSSGYIIRFPLL